MPREIREIRLWCPWICPLPILNKERSSFRLGCSGRGVRGDCSRAAPLRNGVVKHFILNICLTAPDSTGKCRMLKGTDYAHRPYTVWAHGRGRSISESRQAAVDYAQAIEQKLGGATQVVRCFSAWEREISLGIMELSRQEINAASRWREAHVYAYNFACLRFISPGELDIIVSIRSQLEDEKDSEQDSPRPSF